MPTQDLRTDVPGDGHRDGIRPPAPYWVVFAIPPLLATGGGAVEECKRATVYALYHARLQPFPALSVTGQASSSDPSHEAHAEIV